MTKFEGLKTNLELAIPILEAKILEIDTTKIQIADSGAVGTYKVVLRVYKKSLELLTTKNHAEIKGYEFDISGGIRAVIDSTNSYDDTILSYLHNVEKSFKKLYPNM